ncbi:MAG: phenylalanine--tRNA ligase subunit beta [Chloroflexi bacterium]|nr:phenylalanine--tRNA ligase subunit beta [Chloroflexota bacterium]
MKIPLSWLKDYVDITSPLPALAERLTLAGLEVDSITHIGEFWDRDKIFVGQILDVKRHPDAERLTLVRVEYGAGKPLTVVTGAPNLYPYIGQDFSGGRGPKVAFALTGARLVDGHSEERRIVKLKPSKIRGIMSEGMVCSEKELDLSDAHEGNLILPDDAPVGMPLVDYMGDAVLEFDIKGAFGHLQSVIGVAREIAALTGQPLKNPAGSQVSPRSLASDADFTGIVIEAPDLCLRYSAALIEGLTIGPSPLWVQQRLLRAGMRPINNAVDVTNYVMLELGQPLHAFDYDLLRERAGGGRPTIIMRRAYRGEHLTTLDGVERALDPDMLMITDTAGTIAVGGVMGGANTEVNSGTTTILLEAANFNFLSIRRTSQLLKLTSEAGSRFGKQVDPELTVKALDRAGQLLAELAGGTVRPVYGDVYPGKPSPRSIDLAPAYVNRLLGVEIPVDEQARILRALEFSVVEGGGAVEPGSKGASSPLPPRPLAPLHVKVPSHRQDVNIPADLVEEIGRIYGYDRLPHTLLEDELPPQRRNVALEGEEKVRDILVGAGLDEVITYSMIDVRDEARLNVPGTSEVPGTWAELPHVTVLNPLSAERGHLRRTLLPALLNTARANLRFNDRVTIFEVGRIFIPRPGETLPAEPRRVAAVMVGPREANIWLGHDATPLGFFDLKGVAETLVARLGLDVKWERGEQPALHPGRTAKLLVGGSEAGVLGELHPLVRKAFDLPEQPVTVMELDLDVLLAAWGAASEMAELSTQPPVYEDLALIVDEAAPAAQVAELIRQSGGKLLAGVRLFDVYRGGQIPAGKKSLAYALTYQALDRTLTDEDTKKLRAKIVGRLERELGATLRA